METKDKEKILKEKQNILDDIRAMKDKQQNTFIDKLNTDIDWLIEKAMKSTYEPTQHERDVFNSIRQKLENMNKWF